jgi:hypothetical protein
MPRATAAISEEGCAEKECAERVHWEKSKESRIAGWRVRKVWIAGWRE